MDDQTVYPETLGNHEQWRKNMWMLMKFDLKASEYLSPFSNKTVRFIKSVNLYFENDDKCFNKFVFSSRAWCSIVYASVTLKKTIVFGKRFKQNITKRVYKNK